MVSPRRSSRARSTAHPATASSSSSSSSSRGRHARHRTEEDPHGDREANYQRAQDADLDGANDSTANSVEDEAMDDAGDQEDEITRCICGFQEYQGGDDDQTDTDGLFIQCDECKVWQHGFCVAITDSDATPENYYCEKCKPELHKEGHNKSGLKTSIYLPAQANFSQPPSRDAPHKRRTTMNSRDAEYDDEVLKRMLEVSKHDAKSNPDTSRSSRGRKRGTSEGSEELKDAKRTRTSDSPGSPSNAIMDSSDEKQAKSSSVAPSSSRKPRGTTSRNVSSGNNSSKRTSTRNKGAEKAESRKEDSEEQSDDYAPRKNRATQRATAEEPVNPATAASELIPDTPQQATTKRPARNAAANGSRRRNARQTRQSEDPNETGTPMSRGESSAGPSRNDPTSVLEKPTKPRLPPSRISFNEMKKRVNGISEYITRTQVEMANTRQSDIYAYLAWMEEKGTPVSKPTTPKSTSHTATPTSAPSDSGAPKVMVNGNNNGTEKMLEQAADALAGSVNPPALHIMEMLSTKINRWQQHYGETV